MTRDTRRRLEALEAKLQPPQVELADLLTAEDQAHLWTLAREGSPDESIRTTLAGDERGAAILAKLDAIRPRPFCTFVLHLHPDVLAL